MSSSHVSADTTERDGLRILAKIIAEEVLRERKNMETPWPQSPAPAQPVANRDGLTASQLEEQQPGE